MYVRTTRDRSQESQGEKINECIYALTRIAYHYKTHIAWSAHEKTQRKIKRIEIKMS